jgi:hypothetical protein
MVERFIRCRSCNQILPVPSFFGDFGDPAPLPGVEWSNEDENFHRSLPAPTRITPAKNCE